ncbi:MAG: ComEC/Rec2 family competence protein [Actinomycetota bacterium]|nr:ComEC/Rec2 family competence protein [Actinomycetota bacterium]
MRGSLLRLWLLTAGVATGAALPELGRFAWPALAIGLATVCLRRKPALFLLALFLFGFGSGALAARARSSGGESLRDLAKQVRFCDVTGRILEEAGGLGSLASLDHVSCAQAQYLQPGVVVLETTVPAGSDFRASGWVLPLGTDRFDVARARAGAHAELAVDELSATPPQGLSAVATSVRYGLREAGRHLPDEPAGLIRGLTIGDTSGLSQLTIDRFRRAGLSHLLAVSGANVAIVLGGVAVLVARLSFRMRVAAGAVGLFLFVLVVGPDASVLRAAAMGAVGLTAIASGRRAEPLHALGLAVIVIVLLRPQIVYSVGLHLSLAATAGIILWASQIERRAPLPAVVSLPLAVTLAAQVAVLPVLVLVFGEASLVAPVTNLMAAAAVPPATILGLAGAVAGTAHPWLGGLVLRIAEPFAAWILFVGRVGAEPSWATLALPTWAGAVLALPVLGAVIWTLRSYGAPISLD